MDPRSKEALPITGGPRSLQAQLERDGWPRRSTLQSGLLVREVEFRLGRLAVGYRNLLGLGPELFVPRFHRISPSWHVFDLELPVLLAHCEVGVLVHNHEPHHPGMDIALELDLLGGLGEWLLNWGRSRGLGLLETALRPLLAVI